MSKKIIILDKQGGDFTSFKYLFWCDVPSARQSFYANSSITSLFVNATSSEISLLQSGSIKEVIDVITVPVGSTVSSVQSSLVIRFNQIQTDVTNANPWNRYGTFYDGSSWTIGGAA